jgi:hypothetical protein
MPVRHLPGINSTYRQNQAVNITNIMIDIKKKNYDNKEIVTTGNTFFSAGYWPSRGATQQRSILHFLIKLRRF